MSGVIDPGVDVAPSRFLGGWGAVVAFVLGVLASGLAGQSAVRIWSVVDALMAQSGASEELRVAVFYWVGILAWAVCLAFWALYRPRGSSVVQDLRMGVGDWATIGRLVLELLPLGVLLLGVGHVPAGLEAHYDAYSDALRWWGFAAIAAFLAVLGVGYTVRARHQELGPTTDSAPSQQAHRADAARSRVMSACERRQRVSAARAHHVGRTARRGCHATAR